ncbi:MAG: nucleoside triphosphate pyrophosphohydrolase [Gemmatimonadetes bacterium]|nr:nucleoside triphosphate pyrophosphohydrolase [Gemmatimonadota bacterium]
MQEKKKLDDALAIMRDLRARDAWDRAQTHASLRPYLNEEMHELDDALLAGDDAATCSELGDVLLQVLFHSIIAEERGAFTVEDVAGSLVAKMVKRHPWLYGRETTERQQTNNRQTTDTLADDSKREPWEQMKARGRKSLAEGLPQGLPSLHRAHRLQERAAGVGFDWPDAQGPSDKVREELQEVAELIERDGHEFATHGVPSADPRHAALEGELGDLLFAVVNLCRKCGVHPALALDGANAKFQRRFEAIEAIAAARGIDVRTAGLATLDSIWDEVKRGERQ